MSDKVLMSVLLALAMAIFASAARAETIPLSNAGFESQILSEGSYAGPIPNWNSGTGMNPNEYEAQAHSQNNLAAVWNGATIYQDTGHAITASETYTLQWWEMGRTGLGGTDDRFVDLTAALQGATSGGTGASQVTAHAYIQSDERGVWMPHMLTWTPAAGDPLLGQNLRVRFTGWRDGAQNWFQTAVDDVSLSYTPVPEPPTLMLLAAAGIAVLLWWRRAATG